MEDAAIDDWFIALDENDISVVQAEGHVVPTRIVIDRVSSPLDLAIQNEVVQKNMEQHEEEQRAQRCRRDIPRVDYERLNAHGVGGKSTQYSVHNTILHAFTTVMADPVEPKTYTEAMESEFYEDWNTAICDELASIYRHGTWHESNLPEGVKPLTTSGCLKSREVTVDKSSASRPD